MFGKAYFNLWGKTAIVLTFMVANLGLVVSGTYRGGWWFEMTCTSGLISVVGLSFLLFPAALITRFSKKDEALLRSWVRWHFGVALCSFGVALLIDTLVQPFEAASYAWSTKPWLVLAVSVVLVVSSPLAYGASDSFAASSFVGIVSVLALRMLGPFGTEFYKSGKAAEPDIGIIVLAAGLVALQILIPILFDFSGSKESRMRTL